MSIRSRPCFPAARTPLALLLGAGFFLGGFLAELSPSKASAAQAATAEDGFLALIVRSPLERSGDLDALAARWLEELPRHAADFRAELLLRRLSRLPPALRKPSDLILLAEKALEASFASGVTRQVLIDILIDLYRTAGREDDRRRLQKDRGHLLDWLVIGPFGKGKRSHFLEAYPPELEQRLEGVYRDGWQDLSWRKAMRMEEEPQIDPSSFVYPSNGVTYFLSQVRSDRELDALLQRGAPRRIQIWLNGVRIADDDPDETPLTVRRATAVRLAAGWNRILVKSRDPFWIRLCDAAGHTFPPGTLLEEKLEEKGAVLHEAASPVGDAREVPFGALGPWEEWIGKLESAGSPRLALTEARVGLALLEEAYGRPDLAVLNLEKAAAGLEEDSLLLLHAGQIYRHAEYLPPTIAKNRAKDAFEKALALDPALVPAYERVARILEEDEKPSQAAAKLKEGLERAPMSLALLLRLRAIYARAKWKADEIDVLRRIEEAAPSSTIPSSFWVEHYERLGNIPEAVARGRRVLELDQGDARQHWHLADLERKRGNLEGAEAAYRAAIRLAPNSDGYRVYLARFLIETGRASETLEILTPMAERRPLDPEPRKLLAEARLAMGDDAGAAALHQEALALDPGDIALGRYLASRPLARGAAPAPSTGAGAVTGTAAGAPGAIEGPDDFWAPHDARLEDWIPQVPDSGPLVDKASSIIVLDIMVLRLELDGSHSEYVHQASKLLSEQSKEELANVQTQGEILKLRTLTPSGETLEPVAGEGKRSFVMPGLTPGAFVEFAYRDDDANNHGAPVNTPAFYFQDMRFTQSFLLSRLVVLIPKGLDVGFVENNVLADSPERAGTAGGDRVEFARVEKTVVEREDGTTVVTYEARNVPRLEREQGVPSSEEYIPNVEILQKLTWGEIAGQMRERYQRGAKPTPELARAAADATAGIGDPLERAKALYDHVNQIIPTEGGSPSAVATLLQKAGSRNVLYKALLDLAGVPARWAFLRPPEVMLARTHWAYPQASFFTYPYIALELEGRPPLYVSLSDRLIPFARLPEHLQGGKALIVDRQGQRFTEVPEGAPEENATWIRSRLELGGDLDVTAAVEMASHSVMAYAQKDRLKTLPAFQKDLALRQLANQLFPGAKVKSAEMPGIEDPSTPMTFSLSLTAPKLLRKSGDGYLMKPVLQPQQMVRAFAGRSKRDHPFHQRGARVTRDSLRIEAGKSYRLHRTPVDVTLAGALGTYSLRYRVDGDTVLVEREVTLVPGRIPAQEFPDFIEFCEKVDTAERESVIFKKRT